MFNHNRSQTKHCIGLKLQKGVINESKWGPMVKVDDLKANKWCLSIMKSFTGMVPGNNTFVYDDLTKCRKDIVSLKQNDIWQRSVDVFNFNYSTKKTF